MMEFSDWGCIEYAEAWKKQKELFDARVRSKDTANNFPDIAVFCEHPHVFTLGKSGVQENLLISNQGLKDRGVSFFRTDRGGDITYHGPGQIVSYPIFDLEHFNIGLRQYIYKLEEAVILFLLDFGLKGERLAGATGVWLDVSIPEKTRKICAIGVKSSRFVTMHGLALNINTDLSYYTYINPCGFTDKGVTSIEKELGRKQDIEMVKKTVRENLQRVFDLQWIN